MLPGTYDGMTNEDYHADADTISKSGLSRLYDNPARFRFGEQKRTTALAFGQLVHAAVLEPDTLAARFYASGLDRFNEKDGKYKDELVRASGRTLVKQADYDLALRMRDAVHTHAVARAFLTPDLIVERTLCWDDPASGVRLRARPDGIARQQSVIIDLKTCEDAGEVAFAKSVHDYRYHWQTVIYSDGTHHTEAWRPEAFIFLAVEKEPPYLTATYELIPDATDLARLQIDDALSAYAACLASNEWPGHGPGLIRLDLPSYAYRNFNDRKGSRK